MGRGTVQPEPGEHIRRGKGGEHAEGADLEPAQQIRQLRPLQRPNRQIGQKGRRFGSSAYRGVPPLAPGGRLQPGKAGRRGAEPVDQSARTTTMRIAEGWPWTTEIIRAFERLAALPEPVT